MEITLILQVLSVFLCVCLTYTLIKQKDIQLFNELGGTNIC